MVSISIPFSLPHALAHIDSQTETQIAVLTQTPPSSLTCRARRVKCDEGRPICRNCARGARSCRYKLNPLDGSPSAGARNYDSVPVTPGGFHPVVVTSNERPALSPRLPEYTALQPPPHPSPYPVANLTTILQNAKTRELSSSPYRETHDIGSSPAPTRLSASLEPVGDGESLPTPFRVPDPIGLSDVELLLFRNYVDKISKWVLIFINTGSPPFTMLEPFNLSSGRLLLP